MYQKYPLLLANFVILDIYGGSSSLHSTNYLSPFHLKLTNSIQPALLDVPSHVTTQNSWKLVVKPACLSQRIRGAFQTEERSFEMYYNFILNIYAIFRFCSRLEAAVSLFGENSIVRPFLAQKVLLELLNQC